MTTETREANRKGACIKGGTAFTIVFMFVFRVFFRYNYSFFFREIYIDTILRVLLRTEFERIKVCLLSQHELPTNTFAYGLA